MAADLGVGLVLGSGGGKAAEQRDGAVVQEQREGLSAQGQRDIAPPRRLQREEVAGGADRWRLLRGAAQRGERGEEGGNEGGGLEGVEQHRLPLGHPPDQCEAEQHRHRDEEPSSRRDLQRQQPHQQRDRGHDQQIEPAGEMPFLDDDEAGDQHHQQAGQAGEGRGGHGQARGHGADSSLVRAFVRT
ncbi:hypothetical protein [Alloyangia mangrovi]|uniref:hypothetical protein n=1 Tax=Alloyangia mangrovi TaxID=1779329 RepID=UPI00288C5079|nr:hypothetical protein [Alloyangia mangrovi]